MKGLASIIILFLALTLSVARAQSLPYTLPQRAEIIKFKSAEIITNRGAMIFELFPENAPRHVANFKFLADQGFYKGVRFHIHQADYIIQGGIPGSMQLPVFALPPEFSDMAHERGTLGMARAPNEINTGRQSSPSQFHILMRPAPHMDGQYTIFGQMLKGDEVLERLKRNDTILAVRVFVSEE